MEFRPSQEVTTPDGLRWRKCAGVAIVNSRGELLVGERIKIAGAWNCPQGGMDATSQVHGRPETVLEAAAREAWEEVGIVVGKNILPLAAMSDDAAVRYKAGGWLAEAGFAGQQLHWALFEVCDALGDADPSTMCTLCGLGGEEAEFRRVRWQRLEDVISGMWEKKRPPYEALAAWAQPLIRARAQQAALIDMGGVWERDASRSNGLIEALVARGHDLARAKAEATRPYVQEWARHGAGGDWQVTTYNASASAGGAGKDRCITYALGQERTESYFGKSTIFGDAAPEQPATLTRRTAWLPLDHLSCFAHTTVSRRLGSSGGAVEITSRHLRLSPTSEGAAGGGGGEEMVVTRTLRAPDKPAVVSEEVVRRRGV